jgi:lipoprotein NlpI
MTVRRFFGACALGALLVVAWSGTARAQNSDTDVCTSSASSADDTVAACTRLINSGTESNEDLTVDYVDRGVGYSQKGEYALAIADDTRAIQLTPKTVLAYLNRGRSREAIGQYAASISDETTAIRLGVSGAQLERALATRGVSYEHMANLHAALPDLSRAVAMDPSDWFALEYQGIVEQYDSEYAQAFAVETRAIKLDPSNPFLYRVRADIDMYMGRYAAAIPQYRRSISTDPPYISLWLFIAQNHLHQSAAAAFATNTATVPLGTWPAPVIEYYLGHMTRAQVFAAANNGTAVVQNNQHCEASFYLGEWELFHGETSAARTDLRRAAAICPVNFVEHNGAKVELSRL